ncbi:hypothetical protein RB595_009575 [Gaeumannomyces hyphopodioides]
MPTRPVLAVNPPALNVLPDLPPVSALFLIEFDVKAGYTVTWKQAIAGLELEGVVEYKSLPSGLHTVSEDLIYFIHEGGYAGLSAFVNAPTEEEGARHARMIAVGVLVPLSYGRLGRSWRHAEGLREMAEKLATDPKDTSMLERYWTANKAPDAAASIEPLRDSPLSSPSVNFATVAGKGHSRKRSASDGNALIAPGHRLSPFHPAWSLTALLDTFGPLIFPIHRAALLRKRILISTHAPVHQVCDYVYDISVLSNIPLSLFGMLGPTAPSQRLRPLFTIGVHDIPFLIEDQAATAAAAVARKRRPSPTTPLIGADDAGAAGSGWVACTTDSILAMKNDLWDVLITMPPPHSPASKERVWPTVELPGGVQVRATQRDLRRFRNLRAGLARLAPKPEGAFSDSPRPEAAAAASESGARPVTPRRPGTSSGWSAAAASQHLGDSDALLADASEKVVEPTTWAALAYSGFMWWASAGEQRRSEEAEEAATDAGLLTDLAAPASLSPRQRRGSGVGGSPLAKAGAGGQGPGMADSVMSLPVHRTPGVRTVGGASDTAGGEATQQSEEGDEERARVELATIAYFRRLTTQIIAVVADIVESGEDDDDDDDDDEDDREEDLTMASAGDSETEDTGLLRRSGGTGSSMDDRGDGLDGSVSIDSDALTRMGLDVWSNGDVAFVREVTALYFSRRAKVESKCVEVCGLRVC